MASISEIFPEFFSEVWIKSNNENKHNINQQICSVYATMTVIIEVCFKEATWVSLCFLELVSNLK